MSFTKECCTLPPVSSDYVPIGSEVKIGETVVYETADKSPKKLLVLVYDIFGVHPNLRQVADKLSLAGFRIVVPDFFRGNTIDETDFPPKDMSVIYQFAVTHGSYSNTVKTDLQAVLKHYQEKDGITSVGIFGFCWGGRIALDAASDLEEIKASGLVHPSMCKTEDAEGVKCPMILLPAMSDPDMLPFYDILKKNLGESNCAHHRFDDVHHGFVGARGDFANELNQKRVNEVIQLLQTFFTKHVV